MNYIINFFISVSKLSLILCLVSLFFAGLVRFFLPEIPESVTGLLFTAGVLFLFFLLGSLGSIKETLSGKRGWYMVNTVVMTAAFITIMVLANYLGATGHQRIDVTASGKFSLAPQTIRVIKEIKSPIEIIGFFPAQAEFKEAREKAADLLEEYRYVNKLIKFRMVDPEVKPDLARQYRVRYSGTILFVNQDRSKVVMESTEQEFTNALLEVNGIKAKKIYFLTGHGEKQINDQSAGGYSAVKAGLIRDLYKVASLNLAEAKTIPLDCAVLVISGASKALLSHEMEAIQGYVHDNGKLLLLADPNHPEQLRILTSEWGLTLGEGHIRDKKSYAPPDIDSPAVFKGNYPRIVITDGLDTTYFPGVAPLDLTQGLKRVLRAEKKDTEEAPREWPYNAAQQENLMILPILLTTKSATLETGDKDKDQTPPHVMGAMIVASQPLAGDKAQKGEPDKLTRIVVIGDSDFASNVHIGNGGNGDIFLNSVNWLSEEEHLMSIRPKQDSFRRLVLGKSAARFVRFSSAGLLPFLVLVAGAVVWWRKR